MSLKRSLIFSLFLKNNMQKGPGNEAATRVALSLEIFSIY